MQELTNVQIYEGYKGIGLDNFRLKKTDNLLSFMDTHYDSPSINNIEKEISNLDRIKLFKVQKEAKRIMERYFTLHDINVVDIKTLTSNQFYFANSRTGAEVYDKINSLLTAVHPFDIPMELAPGHAMEGRVIKVILAIKGHELEPNRKMYFNKIHLGKELNDLSVGTIAHEVAHLEQESNIGYAKDYLNKEVISTFIEKLVILEKDPTQRLLKLSDRMRMKILLDTYYKLRLGYFKYTRQDQLENLMYVKSILIGQKLFDSYMLEKDLDKREKYIEGIQKVFDNKITVEDLIKGISIEDCVDTSLLERHI